MQKDSEKKESKIYSLNCKIHKTAIRCILSYFIVLLLQLHAKVKTLKNFLNYTLKSFLSSNYKLILWLQIKNIY